MRKSRFSEEQIIGMIKEQEAGLPTVDVCRKHGLSPATFYKLDTFCHWAVVVQEFRFKGVGSRVHASVRDAREGAHMMRSA